MSEPFGARRGRIKWLLKLSATVVMLSALVWTLDTGRIATTLADARPGWLAAGAMVATAFALLRVLKWHQLTTCNGLDAPFGEVARLTLHALVLGIVTPGRVGEALCLAPYPSSQRPRGLLLFAFDRGTEVAVVLVLAIPAAILFLGTPGLTVAALAVLPTLVLFGPFRRMTWLNRLAGRLPKIARPLAEAVGSDQIRLRWTYLALNVVSQLTSYLGVVAFVASLGPINSLSFVLLIPVVTLSNVLSITIGGLGVREGLAAMLFPLAQVSPEVAASAFLLSFLFTRVVPGLAGMVWSLAAPRHGRA